MSNPMIDFEKLQGIIPDNGNITLTFKKTKTGKIAVLFKSTHSIVKAETNFDSEVKDKAEAIASAKEGLGTVIAFTETPEVLTKTFEEKITTRHDVETTLADAINESTEELNKKIKELKEKKAAKSAAKAPSKPAETTGKQPIKEIAAPKSAGEEGKQSDSAATGTLFSEAAGKGKEAA